MITEKDLEILYYITPTKYRTMLDGEGDPKSLQNTNAELHLEELLLKVTLDNLLKTIVKVFKEKYANPMPIWGGIVNYDIKSKIQSSSRKDIKNLKFDFKYGVKKTFGGDTEYLDNLFLEFTVPFSGLKTIVKNALQGKQFTETTHNGKTVFTIDDSPILKIEITDTTFQMFIDKDSFIDYGQ
ncbi:MAG TPA: hypothetical protein DIW37_02415 [Chryseobacterium sp.]|nr:hypothetical protein [Chryseobacterium sp.]